MSCFVARLVAFELLLTTACAHHVSVVAPIDERALHWSEWAARIEALPVCLPPELQAAPREAPAFAPGDSVHVRGRLALIEFDCSRLMNELIIVGRWLPDPNGARSLREIDDAVAKSGRDTCGSMPGLKVGANEFTIEPSMPVRLWKENDAEVFDALLAQTDAVVIGVVESVTGRLSVVQPTRVCRAPGPSLELARLADDGVRWSLLDGLESLSNVPGVSRLRRAQALRVLYDLSFQTDPRRALSAAERLANEFGDRSRLGRQAR